MPLRRPPLLHVIRMLYLLTMLGTAAPTSAQVPFTASDFVVDLNAFRTGTASADTAAVVIRDPWLAPDKAQHVLVSFSLTLSGQYALVNKLDVREARAWPVSASAALLVGLAKEWYDWRSYGYFSRRDLVADLVGVTAACVFILL